MVTPGATDLRRTGDRFDPLALLLRSPFGPQCRCALWSRRYRQRRQRDQRPNTARPLVWPPLGGGCSPKSPATLRKTTCRLDAGGRGLQPRRLRWPSCRRALRGRGQPRRGGRS